MPKSHAIAVLLIAAGLAAAPASVARANGMETAGVQVRIKAAPELEQKQALRRGEIFRILQGGSVADTALSAHLWQVAGSLAKIGWKPPHVTIHVIVDEPGPPK